MLPSPEPMMSQTPGHTDAYTYCIISGNVLDINNESGFKNHGIFGGNILDINHKNIFQNNCVLYEKVLI